MFTRNFEKRELCLLHNFLFIFIKLISIYLHTLLLQMIYVANLFIESFLNDVSVNSIDKLNKDIIKNDIQKKLLQNEKILLQVESTVIPLLFNDVGKEIQSKMIERDVSIYKDINNTIMLRGSVDHVSLMVNFHVICDDQHSITYTLSYFYS